MGPTGAMSLARTMELLRHPSLSACLSASLSIFDLQRAHAHIITAGLSVDLFTAARLLAAAAIPTSGDLRYAETLFSAARNPSLFMYNTMIRALSQSPEPQRSLLYYTHMLRAGILPDRFTLPFLLRSCSSASNGGAAHCHAVKLGLDSDVFVINNAITMYSACSDLDSAHKVFDQYQGIVDVVSWTAIVTGYSNSGEIDRARTLFDRMPVRNSISWNTMIAGYSQRGRAVEAQSLFDKMPESERNSASWNSMISGFAQSGLCDEAVSVFREMVRSGVQPDEPALISGLSASSQLRSLELGEWVRRFIEPGWLNTSVVLATALVDMYGKCGSVGKAVEVFGAMRERNVYTWNAMIAGLAMSGGGRQVVTLLWKMRSSGVEPNAVTFVGLLSACSHSGLVDEGRRLFDTMTGFYGIRPWPEHNGCMVDLFGRAGMLDEAVEFASHEGVAPHVGLWGALAGACRIHGDAELGEAITKRLIKMEPDNSGRYLLLANIYAAARRWEDAAAVKKLLDERRVQRVPGNSRVVARAVSLSTS